jgi:hypothetical protein
MIDIIVTIGIAIILAIVFAWIFDRGKKEKINSLTKNMISLIKATAFLTKSQSQDENLLKILIDSNKNLNSKELINILMTLKGKICQ